MADELRRLAVEARKRAIGGILGDAENSPWWPHLTPAEQKAHREKVLTCIGVYHDLVLDMIKVGQSDALINEETLRLVQLVHSGQQRLAETLAGGHG